jgi:hypothetical protein
MKRQARNWRALLVAALEDLLGNAVIVPCQNGSGTECYSIFSPTAGHRLIRSLLIRLHAITKIDNIARVMGETGEKHRQILAALRERHPHGKGLGRNIGNRALYRVDREIADLVSRSLQMEEPPSAVFHIDLDRSWKLRLGIIVTGEVSPDFSIEETPPTDAP